MGIGLVTTIRVALSPELRRSIIQSLAERFPIEELLDELVLDADVVHDPAEDEAEMTGDAEAGGAGDDTGDSGTDADSGAETKQTAQQRRRRVSRARGDTNGQHGRKPPNRGTRA